jgi:hypothetical protein
VIAKLTPEPAVLETERARLRNQINNTERQLANLGAAVAAGGSPPTLLESIKDREAVLAGLRATLRDVDQRQTLTQMDPAALDARLRRKLRSSPTWPGATQRRPVVSSRRSSAGAFGSRPWPPPAAPSTEWSGPAPTRGSWGRSWRRSSRAPTIPRASSVVTPGGSAAWCGFQLAGEAVA